MLRKLSALLLAVMMVCATFASTALAAQATPLPPSAQPVIDKIEAILAKLDTDEKQVINDALHALKALQPEKKKEITKWAWSAIDSKFEAPYDREDFPAVTETDVSELFIDILSVLYGDAEAALTDAYNNRFETIKQLVKLGGKTGLEEVTFDDLADLVSDLEDKLKDQLANLSWSNQLRNGFNQTFNTLVSNAYNTVINATDNPLGEAFKSLGIDGTILIKMKDELESSIDPDHEAAFIISVGYLRTDVALASDSGGSSLNAQLIVLGNQFPNSMLNWTKVDQVSGTDISVSSDGQITLNGTGTGVAKVKASLKVFDLKLFEGNVTLSAGTSGGGTGGNQQPPSEETEPAAPDILDRIEEIVVEVGEIAVDDDPAEVAEKVKSAVETITSGVQEAVTIAQTAITQAATVKASVVSENGVAKAVIDETTLTEQIAAIQQLAEEMAKKLEALQATANEKLAEISELAGAAGVEEVAEIEEIEMPSLKIELVIDLGDVEEEQAEAVISETIITAVKAAGITHVAITVKGAKLSVPAADLTSETNIRINHYPGSVAKKDVSIASASVQAAASDNSYIRARMASEAYEMKVVVGDQEVTSFAEPVYIGIPVSNANAYDKELLTIVSVDGDNQYTYFTGVYNEETGYAEAWVYSLTGQPYAVVETVVTFNDLAPVQGWAGREIAVVASKGIINGKQAGIFDPTAPVTRAEFAKMIVLAYNLYDPNAEENFTDVSDSDWFKPYVASAVKHGLINGKGNGRFDPLAPITRAEMATIAARALQYLDGVKSVSNVDAALSKFADAGDIAASLRAGTALAARYGIVIGSDGKFNPNGESTRAAAAVVIYRLINVN